LLNSQSGSLKLVQCPQTAPYLRYLQPLASLLAAGAFFLLPSLRTTAIDLQLQQVEKFLKTQLKEKNQ
jgi:hypothetical protein